jgi:hypothetical protein
MVLAGIKGAEGFGMCTVVCPGVMDVPAAWVTYLYLVWHNVEKCQVVLHTRKAPGGQPASIRRVVGRSQLEAAEEYYSR